LVAVVAAPGDRYALVVRVVSRARGLAPALGPRVAGAWVAGAGVIGAGTIGPGAGGARVLRVPAAGAGVAGARVAGRPVVRTAWVGTDVRDGAWLWVALGRRVPAAAGPGSRACRPSRWKGGQLVTGGGGGSRGRIALSVPVAGLAGIPAWAGIAARVRVWPAPGC